MKELYLENGEKAGMWDVVDWWTEHYPKDVFPGLSPSTRIVADIRDKMLKLESYREGNKND